jgi:polysaccharide deacetylase family protein (PEP-CTERM system associated)
MTTQQGVFLFSVDLEDVRENVVNGQQYVDRVVENTELYFKWLDKHNSKCTFFVVGLIAERYPQLIQKIIDKGHEIACHSYNHTPVTRLGKDGFAKDLDKNLEALHKAGAKDITGFRAPTFSLTQDTQWAYEVLTSKGFTYSSSVLPAKSPLFGWEGFGSHARKMNDTVVELPMTLGRIPPLTIPIGGGVYFRVLPKMFLYPKIKKALNSGSPLLSYIHPYDADTKQEYFTHEHMTNPFFNWLMYYNRKNLFNRLDDVMKMGCKIMTYKEYINQDGVSF